jgi:hypothetical protein
MYDPDLEKCGLKLCIDCRQHYGSFSDSTSRIAIYCDCPVDAGEMVCRTCSKPLIKYGLLRTYVLRGGKWVKKFVPVRLKHYCTPYSPRGQDAGLKRKAKYVCRSCEAGRHWDCLGDLQGRKVAIQCLCGESVSGFAANMAWRHRISENQKILEQCEAASSYLQ